MSSKALHSVAIVLLFLSASLGAGLPRWPFDVTGSVDINKIWAAVKQGLLFTVSYAGLAQE